MTQPPFIRSHDLPLPAWGPYGKKWHGVSHIADLSQGIRMDVVVAPGKFRRGIRVPSAVFESAYAPVKASPDLHFHQWSYQLGDGLEMTLNCHTVGDQECQLQCLFHNKSALPESAVLHLMPTMQYPAFPNDPDDLGREATVNLPEGAHWVNAEAYSDLSYAHPDHRDRLPYDGHIRGTTRAAGLVRGRGVGGINGLQSRAFGCDAGDRLSYALRLDNSLEDAWIGIRACCLGSNGNGLLISGLGPPGTVSLARNQLELAWIHLGNLGRGDYRITLTSLGGDPLLVDGFVMLPGEARAALSFGEVPRTKQADRHPGPLEKSLLLHWPGVEHLYGIAWDYPNWRWRNFHTSDLNYTLPKSCNNHINTEVQGPGDGWFGNIYMGPLVIPAKGTFSMNAVVACGDAENVRRSLLGWSRKKPEELADSFRQAENTAWQPAGEAPGVQRLAATTLTNVVFPVDTRGKFIRHATPGRHWDSLYTWDSGFIALGLSEINPTLSLACIEAYLCGHPEDDSAFIHHGSLLPVQFWAAKALLDRLQDREMAAQLFPRLCRMHDFFMGRWPHSTVNSLASGLLRPWDYFYNSGGWDDYPPQKWLQAQPELKTSISPVVITAHVLRAARILKGMASWLELDTSLFKADIDALSKALETHAWNEQEGHYSYIIHDSTGQPIGPLMDPASGVDFNRGLDGLSPLVAGCLPQRAKPMFMALADKKRFWTPIGLSTVDRSAPYYRKDGYWNGAVWMPHQYFFWRACLDWGEAELAWKIAETALNLWEQETAASGYCFEHFLIASQRGAGWHHFSGLSTPPLLWHAAYHAPRRLSVGSDCWIKSQEWSGDDNLTAELHLDGRREGVCTVLVSCPKKPVTITWNNQPVPTLQQGDALAITLPRSHARGTLHLFAAQAQTRTPRVRDIAVELTQP